ncbi:MAG: hypothetical protein Q8Q81_16125 [Oxalobacteraceae bacterium]|nr:hypothetical protein [Oxalobacteraceae bacterium]
MALISAGSPDAPGVKSTMINTVPAQIKIIIEIAMIARKVEKFVVDDIANSCNGWTLSNTPSTAAAENRF